MVPTLKRQIGWLAGAVTLIASAVPAQNYNWSNGANYGEFSNDNLNFTYSEIDRQQAIDDDRKYAESQAREQRKLDERAAKEQRRRDAKVTYVPKAPQQAALVVNYDNQTVTADRIVDSMVESQNVAAQAQVKVPPAKTGYDLVVVGDNTYYNKDGVFYIDMNGQMAEVPAPPGALVTKLPPGFEVRDIDAGRFYVYKDAWYERVMVSGTAAFKVVEKKA